LELLLVEVDFVPEGLGEGVDGAEFMEVVWVGLAGALGAEERSVVAVGV
jgi:hypothetical protein